MVAEPEGLTLITPSPATLTNAGPFPSALHPHDMSFPKTHITEDYCHLGCDVWSDRSLATFRHPEHEDNMFLQNVDKDVPDYRASHPSHSVRATNLTPIALNFSSLEVAISPEVSPPKLCMYVLLHTGLQPPDCQYRQRWMWCYNMFANRNQPQYKLRIHPLQPQIKVKGKDVPALN
jgi:hypothetical protein